MKYNLNDASDIFGNVISIQPQILTINGKRVVNSKDDNLYKKDDYKKEKSPAENDKEDYNSYENLLSRILDNNLMEIEKDSNKKRNKVNSEEKLINKSDSKKEFLKKIEKNNKLLISKNTIEKKKIKDNLLKTPSDIKLKRIKTRDYEIKKFENKILDKSEEKNNQNVTKQKKKCQRFSQQVNYPKIKISNADNTNNNELNNNKKDNDKITILEQSYKSELENSKSIPKIEKFSIEGDILSKEESILKKSQFEELNSNNFDIEQDDNSKKISNKPVYVLTNQIVNINKKSIINNLDKKDINNTQISTLTKRSEKKTYKEEYIQTDQYVLDKNNVNFTVEGKKKSWFCCF